MPAIPALNASTARAYSKWQFVVAGRGIFSILIQADAKDYPDSLIGTPLREPDWSADTRARLEKALETAAAVMAVAPEREDSYIWPAVLELRSAAQRGN